MTQTTTDNVTLVQSLYEAFGRGDVPTVLAAMSEHIEWNEAEGNPWHPGHAFVGPQAVVDNVFTKVVGDFEGFTIIPHRFLAAGDTVIMEGRYRAARAHATGKPLDAQVAHVWDLRDGSVVRFQQYVDTRQLADVLGPTA
ncbi:nuclear transport factor 2 family protein [Trujillonella humicola]|uniref:nuclear transport factor 2 family protein n=1 Tax=Trujillonella humicola TaxID=3383699 RepID=UPI00390621A0